jgi:hypothetical protein
LEPETIVFLLYNIDILRFILYLKDLYSQFNGLLPKQKSF